MLDPEEASAVADQFGVAAEQVRRDHLLSHLLAALAAGAGDTVVFFGGTALARTHLPNGRLSEDIDLIAVGDRGRAAARVEATLATGVRREYGRLTWEPSLHDVRESQPGLVRTVDGITVRVQLLGSTGYPPWPTETRHLHQRYRDAPPARLRVLTRAAFAASKSSAWYDRAAPRDLYDLWALAGIGALDAEAAQLWRRFGPTGRPPAGALSGPAPTEASWRAQLAGQTRLTVTADQALAVVRRAWTAGTAAG
jgi:predicted nucleotidyltransferase component of viral defense system